ncbi:MAG: saccharopine dehydrogenase NADP-binding domain-containing protein [Candidatus Nanopelagicales bacterium]
MTDRPDLDVVLLGATGFVGRLTAEHLAATAPPGVGVGLAGRSRERLEGVRAGLGEVAAGWPLLVVDTGDVDSVRDMAERTRVVATTVGPYLRYGMPVVEACARAGTHYADLTGEALFVRRTLEDHAATARATGARIVHSCGFDSIPSDLSVLLLSEAARADGAGTLEETRLLVKTFSGGISGGTIDSLRAITEAVVADRALVEQLVDPYTMSPHRGAEPEVAQPSDAAAIRRNGSGEWVGPFAMATYNTRVVRLSNALSGWSYGRTFAYGEEMAFGRDALAPLRAAGVAVGLGAVAAGMAIPPTRAVLDRLLPSPGEGPDERTRREGHFTTETRTRTTSGARYSCVMTAQGDPGYQATSVMLGQSALALALDTDRLPGGGGVLTPASALGTVLADRLRAQGFTLDVTRLD